MPGLGWTRRERERERERERGLKAKMALSVCRGIGLLLRPLIPTTISIPHRGFAAPGSKSKKGGGGKGGSADSPKAETLSKEVKASTVVGANILKDGADPKILPDSEYPDWLWHLLDKKLPLSELKRKNLETLPYEDLRRFVKLDNRARIKENNSAKAKH